VWRIHVRHTALGELLVRIGPAVGPPTFYSTLRPTSGRIGISTSQNALLDPFSVRPGVGLGRYKSGQRSHRIHFTVPTVRLLVGVDTHFATRCIGGDNARAILHHLPFRACC
jgi:hypothetical protein